MSRLTKRQEKKLVKQTLLFAILAVVLIVIFVFLILPNIVRIAFNFLDGESLFEATDTVPPQVPIVSAPVEATHSAQIKMTGYGEAEAEIVLILNGEEFKKEKINSDGEFELEVPLTAGDNEISFYSIDKAENESSLSKKYSILFDDQPPSIHITSPAENSTITLKKNQITKIVGETEPEAKVYLDSRLVFADKEGYFTATYNLQEGENKIMIKAIDKAGNQHEQEFILNFKY